MPSVGKIESALLLPISLTARNSSLRFWKPSSRTISWAILFDVRDKSLVSDPMTTVGGMSFVRSKEWVAFTGRSNEDQSCDCRADVQTMQHIIVKSCPVQYLQDIKKDRRCAIVSQSWR